MERDFFGSMQTAVNARVMDDRVRRRAGLAPPLDGRE
jgi:hypothetical protein